MPLWWALRRGSKDGVELSLETGADADSRDEDDTAWTSRPLFEDRDHGRVVELFLENRALEK
jgi:hypothetical protein